MASVNKVILVGNLWRDPEVRTFPSGDRVANVTIATSSRYKNRAGEMVEETEWHRIAFFGRLAEIAEQYLRKGSQIYVEGRIKTNKYTDKDGVERFATEIRADQMQMLGSRQGMGSPAGDDEGFDGGGAGNQYPRQSSAPRPPPARPASAPAPMPAPAPRPASGFDDMDDDIPF